MRIDKLICCLRLTKTRERAQAMIEAGQVRLNGARVERCSAPVAVGAVLTLAIGGQVRALRVTQLPMRRGPASEAQGCYADLLAEELTPPPAAP